MRKSHEPVSGEPVSQGSRLSVSTMDLCQSFSYTAEEAVNVMGCGSFQIKLVFLSGFVWMADAFETVMSSILSPLMSCEWELSRWHSALLATVSSLGTMVGGLVFGNISDRFGRKTALGTSLIFLFVFGAVSAGAPSYPWMMTFRALVGFALGAMPQAFTLCCEFAPSRKRGRAVFFLSYFWSFGVVLFVLIAWGIISGISSWRALVGITAVPALCAVALIKWFPESLSYLCASGQRSEAEFVLREMSNHKIITGKLLPESFGTNSGNIAALWNPKFRRSTIILSYCWFWVGVAYNGLLVLSPPMLAGQAVTNLTLDDWRDFLGNTYTSLPCLDTSDVFFVQLLWTRAADLPGMLSLIFFADRVNKKWLSCSCCLAAGIFTCFLLLPVHISEIRLFLLFFSRALVLMQFQILMLITSEMHPTAVRGVSLGMGTTFHALGAFLASYIVQGLCDASVPACIAVLGLGLLLAGVACVFLTRRMGKPSLGEAAQ